MSVRHIKLYCHLDTSFAHFPDITEYKGYLGGTQWYVIITYLKKTHYRIKKCY